jgi:hypothetical protein
MGAGFVKREGVGGDKESKEKEVDANMREGSCEKECTETGETNLFSRL